MKWDHTVRGKAKRLMMNKRRHCSKHKIPFDLDEEWYTERLEIGCELTWLPFKLDCNQVDLMSPTVDQIIPGGGYLKENCRMVLHGVNMFKGVGCDEDMYFIAQALIDRRGKHTADFRLEQFKRTMVDMDKDPERRIASKGFFPHLAKRLIECRPTHFTEPQIRTFLGHRLTDRQLDIMFKKQYGYPLTKTEGEYYSRTIKKKLQKML